jgi:hypothetical protein
VRTMLRITHSYKLRFNNPYMNSTNNPISLHLSPETTHEQCLIAIRQARNTSHALATLIALQSFVTATAQPSDRDTPAHRAIKEIIEGHAAALRTQLMNDHASTLTDAMRAKDCAAITKIHGDFSRNGFWQAAQLAVRKLDAAERRLAMDWAQAWHLDAQSRALAASGYPEALNFQKAGISPQEYAALTDLNNCLQNTSVDV